MFWHLKKFDDRELIFCQKLNLCSNWIVLRDFELNVGRVGGWVHLTVSFTAMILLKGRSALYGAYERAGPSKAELKKRARKTAIELWTLRENLRVWNRITLIGGRIFATVFYGISMKRNLCLSIKYNKIVYLWNNPKIFSFDNTLPTQIICSTNTLKLVADSYERESVSGLAPSLKKRAFFLPFHLNRPFT